MKPRIFIGSSVEKLNIAEYIQLNLEHISYPEIWSQNIFKLSTSAIESLFECLNNCDFAIFILSPDDVVEIRSNKSVTPRDNVIFELGLFMGKLGRNRVFYLIPRDTEIHLPTDLLGITPGTYDSNHPNLIAAIGPFCSQIKDAINKLHRPEFPFSNHIGENILNESVIKLNSEVSYSLDTTTPSKFDLKIIMINKSINPEESKWYMSLHKIDNWFIETYNTKSNIQEFQLSGGKNGKMEIHFQGNGSADIEFYKGEELFYCKEIKWEK